MCMVLLFSGTAWTGLAVPPILLIMAMMIASIQALISEELAEGEQVDRCLGHEYGPRSPRIAVR